MDTSDEEIANDKKMNQDQEPHRHQFFSPVLIYDYEQKTVQVRSKKNAGQ